MISEHDITIVELSPVSIRIATNLRQNTVDYGSILFSKPTRVWPS